MMQDECSELRARANELIALRLHWVDKLQNQRMRYIKWLRKIEPIDNELRELSAKLWECWNK